MNRREKCRSAVITIFLYQRKCFGKQPDTCPKLVFLPVILQPEVSLIVRVKILTGNAHRIGIGGSRITGKQEKVTGEDMRGAPCRYFHIADFLEVLTAQCPRCTFCLLWKGEIGEETPVCVSLLVGDTTYLFQNGEIMAHGIYRQSLHVHHIILVVMDELLGKLTESNIFRLELPLDELAQSHSHVVIAGISSFGTVDADTCLQVLTDTVSHSKQCHLCFHAALEQFLDRRSVKVLSAFHQGVESMIYGK